jgi:hypothetical protein
MSTDIGSGPVAMGVPVSEWRVIQALEKRAYLTVFGNERRDHIY